MTNKIWALPPSLMKCARHGFGLSQDELAEEAKVHPNSVWRWENVDGSGLEHPQDGTMSKIILALIRLGMKLLKDGSITMPPKPKKRGR